MRLTGAAVILLAAGACASPGLPPGGPPDASAPVVVQIAPDSGRANVTPRSVVFRFDEVVSETPATATTLADLFVISPREGTPVVDWGRDEVAVRPRRGWARNTVYTITMLPGLADLRGNTRRTGVTTIFSTGASIPRTVLRGVVFDWAAGRPAVGAFVEALTADSVSHVTFSDSGGRFDLPHLAPGVYRLQGVVDGNKNRALDPREPWDSATVSLTDTAALELHAFVHDSIGPRIASVAIDDSVTLRVSLEPAVDPSVTPRAEWFAVTAQDSARIPISSVSVSRAVEPGRAPADTATGLPRMSRERPITELLIVLGVALEPGITYTVTAAGMPGLLGRSEISRRTVTVPQPTQTPPRP